MSKKTKSLFPWFNGDILLADSRRAEITRGAASVFAKKGYHGAGMREIAAACKLSVCSIYNYVGSKEDLLFLVIRASVERPKGWANNIIDILGLYSTVGEALADIIDEYYNAIAVNREITLFAYRESRNLAEPYLLQILETALKDISVFELIIRKGIERGEFHDDNPEAIAHNIVMLAHTWALRYWFLSKKFTLSEYISIQTSYFMRLLQKST